MCTRWEDGISLSVVNCELVKKCLHITKQAGKRCFQSARCYLPLTSLRKKDSTLHISETDNCILNTKIQKGKNTWTNQSHNNPIKFWVLFVNNLGSASPISDFNFKIYINFHSLRFTQVNWSISFYFYKYIHFYHVFHKVNIIRT